MNKIIYITHILVTDQDDCILYHHVDKERKSTKPGYVLSAKNLFYLSYDLKINNKIKIQVWEKNKEKYLWETTQLVKALSFTKQQERGVFKCSVKYPEFKYQCKSEITYRAIKYSGGKRCTFLIKNILILI